MMIYKYIYGENKCPSHVELDGLKNYCNIINCACLNEFHYSSPIHLANPSSMTFLQSYFLSTTLVYSSFSFFFQKALHVLSETWKWMLKNSLINIITISSSKLPTTQGLWLTFTSFLWLITEQSMLIGREKAFGNIL